MPELYLEASATAEVEERERKHNRPADKRTHLPRDENTRRGCITRQTAMGTAAKMRELAEGGYIDGEPVVCGLAIGKGKTQPGRGIGC